jgi:hypothetical protein
MYLLMQQNVLQWVERRESASTPCRVFQTAGDEEKMIKRV